MTAMAVIRGREVATGSMQWLVMISGNESRWLSSAVVGFQTERQLVSECFRKWNSFGVTVGAAGICAELLAHDDAEPALAVHHDAVLFFVLSLAEIRQIDADGLAALLDLRPDADRKSVV